MFCLQCLILYCCYFTFNFSFHISTRSPQERVFTNKLFICISDKLSVHYFAFPCFLKAFPYSGFVCFIVFFCYNFHFFGLVLLQPSLLFSLLNSYLISLVTFIVFTNRSSLFFVFKCSALLIPQANKVLAAGCKHLFCLYR